MATRLFALIRSIFFAILFVSLWTWFVPRWMAAGRPLVSVVTLPAGVLMAIGGAIMVWCVFEFGWTGHGTPMPLDPPRKLVVRGAYRWVRNPMYVGMGLFLTGEALALPTITRGMLILVIVLWVIVTLFVVAYEEPTLRASFGDDYRNYCAHVRRWLPRLTPFDKNSSGAVPSANLD
jgi:protein-S-isoprenylcysteine O-methyltransferase Ste14